MRQYISCFVEFLCEGALELIYPTHCCACDSAGELLCERCREKILYIDQSTSCKNCGAPFGYLCCTECKKEEGWELDRILCASSYEFPVDALIKTYKDKGQRRLSQVIAQLMYQALHSVLKQPSEHFDIICFMPATQEALRRRGFDHMQLIAQDFSEISGIVFADILAKRSTKDQRTLKKLQRFQNMMGAFYFKQELEQKNLRILLLDDVLTTGASIRCVASLLRELEPEYIWGLTLARVW